MKILFLVPYPLQEAPSQRFRFEQYFHVLEKSGHQIQTQSFLSTHDWQIFFGPGQSIKKNLTLLRGFARRFFVLFTTGQVDIVFIHREATPIGPPVFEWVMAKILRKKIIYDFDDAIWLTDRVNESSFLKILKWRSKVAAICRWSHRVSCGNHYLTLFASTYNASAILNPTTIDTEHHHHKILFQKSGDLKSKEEIVIGWTGSHSTLKYLKLLEPLLQNLETKYPQISFLVIADKPPGLNVSRLRFLPWNAVTEIQDLLNIDIGIMPLPDDEWAKGKCGFKALQYMALEIPAVISKVGVNAEIISHGAEGFLCSTEDEWLNALSQLITDQDLRNLIGKKGRQKVVNHYSIASNSSRFLSLFE